MKRILIVVVFCLSVFFLWWFCFFNREIKENSFKKIGSTKKIAGSIIPHHLLADFMVNDFFSRLKKQNPKVIILIGPNHFEVGNPILTDGNDLQIDDLVKIDKKVIDQEISITNVVPIIKQYLPDVKIIPIILRKNISEDQRQKLGEKLSKLVSGDTVIVASIDFSHYLSETQSIINDEQMLKAIREKDIPKIVTFNSGFVDSPASLAVIMSVLKGKEVNLVNHSNSAKILKRGDLPVTSYMEIIFTDSN